MYGPTFPDLMTSRGVGHSGLGLWGLKSNRSGRKQIESRLFYAYASSVKYFWWILKQE